MQMLPGYRGPRRKFTAKVEAASQSQSDKSKRDAQVL